MAIDRKFLEANHADLVAEIRKEGLETAYKQGLDAGAKAERERMLAIEQVSMPGCESLIAELKADGKTSGPEAAVKVLAHYKAQNAEALGRLEADAGKLSKVPATPSQTGDQGGGADAKAEDGLPVEERCKRRWDRNAGGVRDEFTTFEAYLAYEKRAERGQIRRLAPAAR